LHAVLVSRAGALVLERYYKARMKAGANHLEKNRSTPETLHDLRSVTKKRRRPGSTESPLDRGLVPPPEAPLLAQFPEYPDLPPIRNAPG